MHLMFLDESGRLAERKLFALGGIALRDTDWHVLRDFWQSTLAKHGCASHLDDASYPASGRKNLGYESWNRRRGKQPSQHGRT
jgi:hypothetical protein